MNHRPLLLLAVTLLAPTALRWAGAAEAAAGKRPLNADDFYRIQSVDDPQVSPDGKWVAYVVTGNDRDADESRSAVWAVSWDGREHVEFTNPAHGVSTPRWSPDGRYLAYLASLPCSDKSQIMVLDRRGGEPKTRTHVDDDIQSFDWAPDGKRMVLVMDKGAAAPARSGTADAGKCVTSPEPSLPIVIDAFHFKEDKDGYLGAGHDRHLYLLDAESGRIDALTDDPSYNESLPSWSPDGRQLAFVRSREKAPDTDGMQDIERIDARPGAAPEKLSRIYAPNQQRLAWSPDGSTLVFLRGVEARYNQYGQDVLCAVEPKHPDALRCPGEALDRAVSFYAFGPGAASVMATVEDDTLAYVARIDLRKGSVEKIAQGRFVVGGISSAAGHTAVLHSSDASPAEVYALDGRKLRKLSAHNDAWLDEIELGAVEDLEFASADGTPISGLLVKPPHLDPGRKPPAILWIHGGPNLQDSHSLAFDDYQFKRQLLAAQGFVVYGINYRGSSGRGNGFSRAIAADWGHKEVQDLLAGTDHVVRSGLVDPDRLGIGGWSYGGMLTDYTIASTARFHAAASGAGTANPLALYAADQYNLQYAAELGNPWDNTALYLKLAYPFLHADRIKTPTLFMGGSKDFNVPIVGGEQMYLALRTLGIPTQLVVYPGEYHTLTRPSFLKDRLERLVAWYRRYLSEDAPAAARSAAAP